MGLTRELYTAGLSTFAFGAAGGIACHYGGRTAPWVSRLFCFTALVGALLEGGAAVGGMSGSELAWSLPSGVPYLHYIVRLDPLSSFFLLTLSLLAASVTVFSFGYWRHGAAGKNPALSGSLLNLLLAGLTLVFTAADVVFFLIAWEVVVAASYFLVVANHAAAESRKGGLLYILMSRGGTGMLF